MIVIDASVILKWVLENEEDRENARSLYLNHTNGIETITIPNLALAEVANALVTKTNTLPKTIKEDLNFIFQAKLDIYDPPENDLVTASLLAKKYKTTVYDMLYAVVARDKNCGLITADENFIKKTGFKFVKHISEVKS